MVNQNFRCPLLYRPVEAWFCRLAIEGCLHQRQIIKAARDNRNVRYLSTLTASDAANGAFAEASFEDAGPGGCSRKISSGVTATAEPIV